MTLIALKQEPKGKKTFSPNNNQKTSWWCPRLLGKTFWTDKIKVEIAERYVSHYVCKTKSHSENTVVKHWGGRVTEGCKGLFIIDRTIKSLHKNFQWECLSANNLDHKSTLVMQQDNVR